MRMYMSGRRTAARFGLAAAVAGAVVLGGGQVADAATPTADLSVSVSGEKIVENSTYKPFLATVRNNGPATAAGVKITIDGSKLDPKAIDFLLPGVDGDVCTGTSTLVTCSLGDI